MLHWSQRHPAQRRILKKQFTRKTPHLAGNSPEQEAEGKRVTNKFHKDNGGNSHAQDTKPPLNQIKEAGGNALAFLGVATATYQKLLPKKKCLSK